MSAEGQSARGGRLPVREWREAAPDAGQPLTFKGERSASEGGQVDDEGRGIGGHGQRGVKVGYLIHRRMHDGGPVTAKSGPGGQGYLR